MAISNYRAWCIPEKQFYAVHLIQYCSGGVRVDGVLTSIGNGWASCNEGYAPHPIDVILNRQIAELPTIFSDHEERPVFEGDILLCVNSCADKYYTEVREDGKLTADYRDTQLKYALDCGDILSAEVVGNRYENPELLSKCEETS